jgi:hypothetical protein
MASKNEYREYRKGDHIIIPPAQGIYEASTTKMAPLGTRLAFADGRVFRYAYNGAAEAAPGKFMKCAVNTSSNFVNEEVLAAVDVGAYTLTVETAACPTASIYVDGWLQINDAAGEGIQYKIKSYKANATVATSCDVVLYDPIATALTTASEATFIGNPYYATVIATAITEWIIGVPPITVAASSYYWLQTWGMAPVWSEGTPSAGFCIQLAVGNTVAGATVRTTVDTTPPLGIQIEVGVQQEYKPVYLMIAP